MPKGFTLAELLIALAILGVIAAFSIPKILTAQANTKYNALTKEAIATIAGAYQAERHERGIDSDTTIDDIMSHINYIRDDGSSGDVAINSLVHPTDGHACGDSSNHCMYLANGGAFFYIPPYAFCDTAPDNLSAMVVSFDPDGVNNNIKAIRIILYRNGAVRTGASMLAGTQETGGCSTLSGVSDPSWFSWQ